MPERETVQGFLDELGHRVNARLQLDGDGVCPLQYEGLELSVTASTGSASVVFHAVVASRPPEQREAFYERALKLNLMYGETGGAVLGLDGHGRELLLALHQPVAGLDSAAFETLLANFIDVAGRMRSALAEPLEAARPSERRGLSDADRMIQNLDMRA